MVFTYHTQHHRNYISLSTPRQSQLDDKGTFTTKFQGMPVTDWKFGKNGFVPK